jgi:hypothetical protein
MNVRTQAQDAASWYFSQLDLYSRNEENIRHYLQGPLLALTVNALHSKTPVEFAAPGGSHEEEKKSGTGDWRDYLQPPPTSNSSSNSTSTSTSAPTSTTREGHTTSSSSRTTSIFLWNEKGQEAYDSLSRRTKARMEAFLAGCSLAVPSEAAQTGSSSSSGSSSGSLSRTATSSFSSQQAPGDDYAYLVPLQEGLSGFGLAKKVGTSSHEVLSSVTEQGKTLMRHISTTRSSTKHPQIEEEDLVIRLELYIRTMQRVKTLHDDCVIAMEAPKTIKARARYITHAFVATAGCVRSMSPVLTRLLNCLTMEMLAVETLSEELTKVIRRIVSEYEHGTSFASLAFLSTPEVNAGSLLTPLIVKYLKYLQSNWEILIKACELERMLTRALDPAMRKLFKTIEFRSIGHLLEVCHEYRGRLHSIELAPNVCAVAENINDLCNSKEALRQALRDLQREVITVNGHVLPPVTSRKGLLHLLTQTLNSRTLTAEPKSSSSKERRAKKASAASYKRYESAPSKLMAAADNDNDNEEDDETKAPTTSPTTNTNNRKQQQQDDKSKTKKPSKSSNEDSDYLFSSECDESSGMSEAHDEDFPTEQRKNLATRKTRRRNFHLSTIDVLTRRLLIAASRTGNGGDAYFVV